MKFGINKHEQIFQRVQIIVVFVVFEKIVSAIYSKLYKKIYICDNFCHASDQYFMWQMKAASYFNWHANSSVKIHSLSPNHVWKLISFFKCEKQSLLTVELKNLRTMEGKNSLVCSFDAAFLPNIVRVFEKLWAVFNAEKKLFNLAQVALTKIPRNEAKSTKNRIFLALKDIY